jgi:hypothetical protein
LEHPFLLATRPTADDGTVSMASDRLLSVAQLAHRAIVEATSRNQRTTRAIGSWRNAGSYRTRPVRTYTGPESGKLISASGATNYEPS